MTLSVVAPLWQDRPAIENLEVALTADQLDYSNLWIGEMATFDAFALATAAGLQTNNIALGIGPLPVAVRTPMTMAMGAASVAALTGRKVRLAIGSSSPLVVEKWHGRLRVNSARHLSETATILRSLLRGDKTSYVGELASCEGYRLRLAAPDYEIAIAAFGPAAVTVAARQADWMLLNLVTTESVARLRKQLGKAAAEAGRPRPKLAVWLPVAIDPEEEAIQQLMRSMVGYLAAPGYADMFIAAGFAGLVELARSGAHPRTVLAAIPEDLVAVVGAIGTKAAVLARIAAYQAAGADEICIIPATAGDSGAGRTLHALRPAERKSQVLSP